METEREMPWKQWIRMEPFEETDDWMNEKHSEK